MNRPWTRASIGRICRFYGVDLLGTATNCSRRADAFRQQVLLPQCNRHTHRATARVSLPPSALRRHPRRHKSKGKAARRRPCLLWTDRAANRVPSSEAATAAARAPFLISGQCPRLLRNSHLLVKTLRQRVECALISSIAQCFCIVSGTC